MVVAMSELDKGVLLFFVGVCQFGSGGGPVVREVCQVFPAAFWKIIVVFSFPVVTMQNGPFLALASGTLLFCDSMSSSQSSSGPRRHIAEYVAGSSKLKFIPVVSSV